MKIGLASDSFGNLEALRFALRTLTAAGADRIFFLGGRCADLEALLEGSAPASVQSSTPLVLGDDLEFLRAVEDALAQRAAGEAARAEAKRQARRIVAVASRACPEYALDRTRRKVFELVGGRICCLVHDKSELTREDIYNSAVLFHGNSAQAGMVAVGPRVFVTPGTLRASDPGGPLPTFAALDIDGTELELTVYSALGEEMRRERAKLAAQDRVSVR